MMGQGMRDGGSNSTLRSVVVVCELIFKGLWWLKASTGGSGWQKVEARPVCCDVSKIKTEVYNRKLTSYREQFWLSSSTKTGHCCKV